MLKLGLMLNRDKLVPAWAYEVLTEIEKSSYAKFELCIVNLAKIPSAQDPLLYKLFRRIEKRLAKPEPDALRSVSYQPECPVLKVVPYIDRHKDVFDGIDIARIQSYDLDVILRFGFRILSGDILAVPEYGIWSYHHGDYRRYRGRPAGFWEVVNGDPKTGAMLQTLTEKLDGGIVIRSATYQTHMVSPKRNASYVAWQAAHFLPEELKRLDETKEVRFEQTQPTRAKIYTVPTNKEMLRIFPNLLIKKAKSLKRKPWQWQIAYNLSDGISFDFSNFKLTVPPNKDTFWADPFVAFENGKHYIFYEELERGKKAHICCATIENGVFTPLGQALNMGKHLSYPFVFRHEENWFMLPENMEDGTISLYHAQDFPMSWHKVRTLVPDVYAADPTLLHINGIYYIFATKGRKGLTNNSELYLWYSKSLFGNWKLHPASPVQNDISVARPAGKFMYYDHELFRPSQDGINCRVNLNRVEQLDTCSYRETTIVGGLDAWGDFRGLHTLNYDSGLTVVDALHK